jgi:acyl-coenzyme A synthetase/AMP-(fatty) acid ligase
MVDSTEEAPSGHPAAAEVGVIGVRDEPRGEAALVIAVLKDGVGPRDRDRIADEMKQPCATGSARSLRRTPSISSARRPGRAAA